MLPRTIPCSGSRSGAGRRPSSRARRRGPRTGRHGSASIGTRAAGLTTATRTGAVCRWTAASCGTTRRASCFAAGLRTGGLRPSRCGSLSTRFGKAAASIRGRTARGSAASSRLENMVIRLEPRELTDGELRLRPWRQEDVPAMAGACRGPGIVRWTRVPKNYTEDDAREFIAASDERWRRGEAAGFAVTDAATAEVLGSIGVRFVDPGYGRIGLIGYWTSP